MVLDLIDQAEQASGKPGARPDLSDNVRKVKAKTGTHFGGNAAQQALRRPRKDRPDLHAQVLAGSAALDAMARVIFKKSTRDGRWRWRSRTRSRSRGSGPIAMELRPWGAK